MCAAYGEHGHATQERTVLVGYACERHSVDQKTSLWSSSAGLDTNHSIDPLSASSAPKGIRITSAIALSALEEAYLMDDDDTSTEAPDESVMDTISSQTTVEYDDRYEAKTRLMETQATNLDDLRSRLVHPRQYITSLQELEENVWSNSIISIFDCSNPNNPTSEVKISGIGDYIPYPSIPPNLQDILPNRLSDDPFAMDPTNTSDSEITAICQALKDRSASSHLNAIRMCRNMILKTFLNLKLLQQSNFCAGSFSAIIVDEKRPNVAMLQSVENTDFVALLFELEYILRDSASLVLNANEGAAQINLDRQYTFLKTPMVQQYCHSLLQLDLDFQVVPNMGVVRTSRKLVPQVPKLIQDITKWKTIHFSPLTQIHQVLTARLYSYAGAHCSDFPSQISTTIDGLSLLAPFDDCSDDDKKKSIRLRRCQLQCLDAFLHGKAVWVFCPPNLQPSLPMYISTTIEGFSDIWGPLWKLKDENTPDKYSAYVVGGGSIVPWKHDSTTCPELMREQLFCHWMSNEEMEDCPRNKFGQGLGFASTSFDGTERLLIGAPSNTLTAVSEPWAPNLRCSAPISEARTRLREAGRLCIVGASKPYHYNDSSQYQLQVGYSGVNASATRQYKRVPGQSLKDVLVELWAMEPEIRDPTLLEDLNGVEISICTLNAQRVSLAQILRLSCMHHLLRDFNWQDPGYRAEHFLTLEDTLRPKRLLDPQFKERFDYAVMLGLKMLSKTGVDRDDNLQVFLSSRCTPKPELATLVSKEHSWIGLLRDTTTECAMVAFGDTCLEFKYNNGVSCGSAGHSALRSAILLHSSMMASLHQLKLHEETPDSSQESIQITKASTMEVGKSFSLGDRGNLRLKANLDGGLMVMGWSSYSVKMSFKSRLGREPVHREYTEVDRNEEGSMCQPLPVVVVSDNLKGLGKRRNRR